MIDERETARPAEAGKVGPHFIIKKFRHIKMGPPAEEPFHVFISFRGGGGKLVLCAFQVFQLTFRSVYPSGPSHKPSRIDIRSRESPPLPSSQTRIIALADTVLLTLGIVYRWPYKGASEFPGGREGRGGEGKSLGL